MSTPPNPPTPPPDNDRADGGRPTSAAAASSPPVATAPTQGPPRLPSLRVTAALTAGMLALGVAVGAAIGPTPETSLAGERIPLLLPSIGALTAVGAGGHTSATTTIQPPPVTPQVTPSVIPASSGASKSDGATTQSTNPKTPSSTVVSPTSTPNTSKKPTTTGKGGTQTMLPPVTSVWLITLSGGTFTEAIAQPSAAPYITGQLIPTSTLLGGWSALAGSAFASEAALSAATPAGASPPLLHSIVQPPCPEGAAGVQCAPGTTGQLTADDDFLKETLAQIINTPAYKEHGLVVVTFATVGIASQSGLPPSASTATLISQPPAGVALLSPFARAGARPTSAFNPTSPKQSLSGLLH